jgi:hypothetical protein
MTAVLRFLAIPYAALLLIGGLYAAWDSYELRHFLPSVLLTLVAAFVSSCGVILYAYRFRKFPLLRYWRPLFLLYVLDLALGMALDMPHLSLDKAPVLLGLVLLLHAPGVYANYRLAYDGAF